MEMPDGIMMFAPTKIMPMATTKLYSWPAKFRMALDLVIPTQGRWPEGETAQQHDERSRASWCAAWGASASTGSPSRSSAA